uniref:Putative ovule protein n=1 Tax=Solanum chacoense TaxID=4108 RepID=A0A0V0GLN8_SOLCH
MASSKKLVGILTHSPRKPQWRQPEKHTKHVLVLERHRFVRCQELYSLSHSGGTCMWGASL